MNVRFRMPAVYLVRSRRTIHTFLEILKYFDEPAYIMENFAMPDVSVSPISILVVDDEEEIRLRVQQILTTDSIRVYLARDGREASQIIHTVPIDVVISDVNMPKMDGLELLEEAQLNHKKRPEIFLMTGFIDQARAKAIKLGAKGIIQKPFTKRELLTWIHMSISEKLRPYFENQLKYPIRHPVRYSASERKGKSYPGSVLNVSKTGLFIGTADWIPEANSSILCTLILENAETLSFSATSRGKKDIRTKEYTQGFGADFKQTSPDNLQKIEKIIRKLLPKD